MSEAFTINSIAKLLPEITLFFTAIFILLADIGYQKQRPKIVMVITLLGLTVALAHTVLTLKMGTSETISRSLMIDPVSQFFEWLLSFSGLMTALLGWKSREIYNNELAEMQALVVL